MDGQVYCPECVEHLPPCMRYTSFSVKMKRVVIISQSLDMLITDTVTPCGSWQLRFFFFFFGLNSTT
ncbi:hypothetical protein VNO78_18095 [Psophocarpus tetragonolobus]|uniref:Uncharacterized protein n=1 Tax=Psophocarpus tetragonolobus TaxID=3891 RepID=A0AAN9SPB1_PSOTE